MMGDMVWRRVLGQGAPDIPLLLLLFSHQSFPRPRACCRSVVA